MPAHTYHNCPVIIKADESTIFLQQIFAIGGSFLENKFAGNNTNNKAAQSTYIKKSVCKK